MGLGPLERHPPPNAVVVEDGLMLRKVVEEGFDPSIVLCLNAIEKLTTWTFGAWWRRERGGGRGEVGGGKGKMGETKREREVRGEREGREGEM